MSNGDGGGGKPVKVLFSGAIEGGVAGLCKKVEAANKKVGADLLLCVGQFFAPGSDSADPDDELVSYVTGEKDVPVPTYTLGGWGTGSNMILEALPASDCRLRYLGKAGVVKLQGLTIAYLDGTYNAVAYHQGALATDAPASKGGPYYSSADVAALKRALEELEGEVDILLTAEWPRGITRGVPDTLLPEGLAGKAVGSPVVAEIAALARPRYHFAGGVDAHFARLPYINKDLGAGPRATRFISLAPISSQAKQKSLHALALVPSSEQDADALSAIPDGSTPSPYDDSLHQQQGKKRQQPMEDDGAAAGTESWRWNMKGPRGDKRQRGEQGGRGGGGRDGGRGPGPGGGREREPPAIIQGRTDIVRDPYATIIARNMPFKATEAELIHFFSQAGKVVDVIRGASADGRLHSWLTVQYSRKEEAEKALALSGSELMGRSITVEMSTSQARTPASALGVPVEGCWFCLGSASVDLSLVASVGEDAYLAVDKGAITEDHVLVVPVDHYPSAASLSPAAYTETERYLTALRALYAADGKQLVAFERHLALRNKGGNHAHINAIAVPPSAGARAKQAFQQAAKAAGFTLTELPPAQESSGSSQASLKEAVGSSEYFMALLPDGTRLVRPLLPGERWPMALGREVLADLAGVPERAGWKACALTPEEEAARTEKFKARFKAYDIMQQG